MEELIKWMEEESDKHFKHGTVQSLYGAGAIQRCIAKAKSLQATEQEAFKRADALKGEGWTPEEYFKAVGAAEQCKWAVVHKGQIYDTKEECQDDTAGYELSLPDYIIVKIIE